MNMAGRKRKAGVRRQPGGLIDHSSATARRQKAEDMTEVARMARGRVWDLPATLVAKMPESTFLGQLCARGAISARQMAAATLYQEIMHEYDRLTLAKGFPGTWMFDRMGGHDGSDGNEPSYVAKFERAGDRYLRADTALWKANAVDRRAKSVTERVVLWGYAMPHHVDALKIGLDFVADAFGLPGQGLDTSGSLK